MYIMISLKNLSGRKKEKPMGFARFMSSVTGRLIRFFAGLALIIIGLAVVHGTGGIILAVIGAVPFFASIFNVCVFAPLFGGPFFARDIK
jgi:hypothetical protein